MKCSVALVSSSTNRRFFIGQTRVQQPLLRKLRVQKKKIRTSCHEVASHMDSALVIGREADNTDLPCALSQKSIRLFVQRFEHQLNKMSIQALSWVYLTFLAVSLGLPSISRTTYIRQNVFRIHVFRAVIPCSPGDGYRCFGGICPFHHQNL